MRGMEWREVKPGNWWLVFDDAPADLGRNGPVGYPPSTSISWVGGDWACCHLYSYSNGAWPDEHDEENVDYMHVCDPRDLIAQLEAWIKVANYHHAEEDE